MADEWGPWIGWNGGECPVELTDTVIYALRGEGEQTPAPGATLYWEHAREYSDEDIIAYRVKREPVVETVRLSTTIANNGFWSGHYRSLSADCSLGFLVYETRDGIPDMTTLRWEEANG